MKDDNKTREQLIQELAELRSQKAALEKSESAEKYRNLVEDIRDVIYELDSQGVVLYISPAIRDLLGFDSSEIIGKNFIELAHKDDLSSLTEWFSELRKSIEKPHDYRISNKSGELRWARTRTRPVMEDGLFKGARGILIDVTAQKHAEEALRQSEERYRSLFENSVMGISQALPDGHLITANTAYAQMYGYTNSEKMMIAVSNVGQLYANPEDREEVLRILTEKGVMEPREIVVVRRDGTRFTVLVGAREIRDSKGTLTHYQAEHIDITDRKRAEEKLRTSEELFRSYLEYAPDGVYMSDVKGNFLYGNRKCEEIIGYRREELIGKNLLELNILPEKYMNKAAKLLQDNIDGRSTGPDEFELISKEERLIPVEISTSVVQSTGRVIVLAFVRDITDRKKADEKMKRTNIFLDSIIENIPNMIFLKDEKDLRFIQFNRAGEELLGYSRNDLLGKNDYDFFPKEQADHFTEKDREVLSGKKVIDIPEEILQTVHWGERIIHTKKVPLLNEKGEPEFLLGISEDITETKQAEAKLRQQTDAMDAAIDGMAILNETGEFVYVNKAHARLYGYENAGELIGKPWKILYDPEVLRYFEQEVMSELSRKGDWHGEAIGTKKNGSKFPQELSLTAMANGGLICVVRDISDRKRAEETLRENEEKYRWVLDNMADVITVMDMNLRFTYVSPSIMRMRGYTAEEAVAQTIEQVMTPDSLQITAKVFEEEMTLEASGTADPGRSRILVVEQYRKDGSIVLMENHLSFMRDDAQKPVGIISLTHDITDRNRAEEALKESENKYRMLADNVNDVIFVLDMNLNYTYVSPSVKFLRGYDPEEVLKQQPSEVLAPSSLDLVMKTLSEIMEPEKSKLSDMPISQTLELEMIRKDGSTVWTEVKFSFIRDKNQRPVGILGLTRDITERKRGEEELRLSEERFRRIFDEGPFGMGLEDPDHTIIAANKVLCGLLGYTEQELAGRSVADVIYEEDREKSKEALEQLFTNGTPVFRQEKRYVRKDGTLSWANTSISAIHGKEGNVLYGLAIIEDITERKTAAEKIRLLAYYDSLTGLPNRTFHKELIKRAIEHAQRHKEIFALIYIGLDNFQRINDTLGHSVGDLLLKAVADRLASSMRKSDYVARSAEGETEDVISRVGGDEFIILAHDIAQSHYAAKTSRRLLEELSVPYDLNGREVFITVSIGIALYPDDGTDVDDLLKNAEKAMRHTKNEGKNNFHFYSSSMHTSVLELLTLENDLHRALERSELVLYYQPKVDAATRRVIGMEALIRWKHPDRGLISPMQFIPMAETSGLIIPIGEFVIRTVCKQIKAWQEAGYEQMNIALNVSSYQFEKQNLIEIFMVALQDTMISPQCLEVEITESTIMRNPEKAIQILMELKTMGIGISIDDFGTGYSSLSHLKRLPLDFLKIDQSFIKGVASDSRDQSIVRTTIAMAHSLNLKTIAEGVETEEQLSFLQEHGCDEIQGYLFSRPLPAEEIPGILAKGYL
jgi:PAS domain S-box-containing protein